MLPDSIRKFEQSLTEKRLFGHYSANLTLNYSSGKVLKANLGFWVVPWKLMLLVLLGLVVVGWLLKKGLKRYNEHIIAQARRRR